MNEPEDAAPAPTPDRRQLLGLGLKALGYTSPVVAALSVTALTPEEADARPSGMMMMMMHRHRMMMMMMMHMR